MLAKEGECHAAKAVRAFKHDLHQPARMRLRVESLVKAENMLEIGRHHREPSPMRQAFGIKRDDDAPDDGEEPEADPGADQQNQLVVIKSVITALRCRHRIDDPTEEHRLREGCRREKQIRETKKETKVFLGSEL